MFFGYTGKENSPFRRAASDHLMRYQGLALRGLLLRP
jgi:hypothetical protein